MNLLVYVEKTFSSLHTIRSSHPNFSIVHVCVCLESFQ